MTRNGGDAGPPGADRNQRSRTAPLQAPPQQDAQPKPSLNEQNIQRDGTGDRRLRRGADNPSGSGITAPTLNQRSGGTVQDTAPPASKQLNAPTLDPRVGGSRNGGARNGGTRDGAGAAPTNNFDSGARDGKRWNRVRRDDDPKNNFSNIDAIKSGRKERKLQGGNVIIEEPDSRRIIRSGDRTFIMRDETRRMRRYGDVTDTRRRPGGGNITTIARPNGGHIITETSPDGRLIRRYRRTRDGRDIILVDNRRTWRKWGAIGAGAVLATGLLLAIDPPHYRMPRERYIVEYDHASYDDVYDALIAPPIDDIGPRYTLDQVLFNYNLRERMRRIDLDSINFDTGAWDIDRGQYGKLEHLARAIDRVLDRNPDEVFLIEGHTDAVGDAVSNRSLSDRRAEEVANILTEEFNVPPENLVIQGYGEEFLKVQTDGPSRTNRRVTVRRITPLLDRRTSSRD